MGVPLEARISGNAAETESIDAHGHLYDNFAVRFAVRWKRGRYQEQMETTPSRPKTRQSPQ